MKRTTRMGGIVGGFMDGIVAGVPKRAARVVVACVGVLAAAGGAGSVWAEPAGGGSARPAVAQPGPCAEPRGAQAGYGDPDFDVAGPATALFDPVDVAAGPEVEGLRLRPAPPEARGMVRPGACDQPGSGCGAAAPLAPAVVVPPVDPGTRPPRGGR